MGIKRGPLSADNFTIVPNTWLRAKLSTKERGLLAYIASHKADYVLTMGQIIADHEDGRISLDNTIKSLVRKGYLKRDRTRNGDGTLGAYDYTVVESPEGVSAGGDQCAVSHTGVTSTGADQAKEGVSAGGDQCTLSSAGGHAHKEDHLKKTKKKTNNTSSPVAGAPAGGEPKAQEAPEEPEPVRPEVERLCQLLADLIAGDGTKRPTVTRAWRDECRRLMDLDGASEKQVEYVIRWSQAHSFWSANILSMPTLRKQYAQLVKRIKVEHVKPVSGGAPAKSFAQQERDLREAKLSFYDQARAAWEAAHPGESATSGVAMAWILPAAKRLEDNATAAAANGLASRLPTMYSDAIEGEFTESAPYAIGGVQA